LPLIQADFQVFRLTQLFMGWLVSGRQLKLNAETQDLDMDIHKK
jgi:hypothetical protein